VTGRRVQTAKPESVDTLLIRYDSGNRVDWKQQQTLFSLAREASLNVGVSGWYHPYCRLFGSSMVSCFWTPALGVLHRKELMDNLNVPSAMALQYRRMLLEIPGLPYIGFLKPRVGVEDPAVREMERASTRREYSGIHENALRLVADPKLNIVYLHYPVPHMLTIYDRDTKGFSLDDGNNYFDNLLLVDRTIGEIRSALEHAGLWDRTAFLITSDHPLRLDIYRASPEWNAEQENAVSRAPERYIPYMLKLPGQAHGGRYSKAFNCVVTKDLLLAILSRKIVSPQDVIAWLDRT
jgi:sulfatase-like protein